MSSEKLVMVGVKVNLSQKDELEKKAKDQGLSLSDYIRNRLLYDSDVDIGEEDKLNRYQKEILRTTKKAYYLLKLMSDCDDELPRAKVLEAIECGDNFWIKNNFK